MKGPILTDVECGFKCETECIRVESKSEEQLADSFGKLTIGSFSSKVRQLVEPLAQALLIRSPDR